MPESQREETEHGFAPRPARVGVESFASSQTTSSTGRERRRDGLVLRIGLPDHERNRIAK